MCQDGHAGEGRRRYYRLYLDLPDMFGKVVFQGQKGPYFGWPFSATERGASGCTNC